MKLGSLHKALLFLALGLLFVSGAWWGLSAYSVPVPFLPHDGGRNYELEEVLLSTHGVVAMGYLMVLGSLFPLHVKRGWQAKRRRLTGSMMLLAHGALIISAALLYYGSPDGSRPSAQAVHWWVGLALPVLLAVHLLGDKVSRLRAKRRGKEPLA